MPGPAITGLDSAVTFVRLDPSLVAVSCEGVKQALLQELGAVDRWKGSITVVLHPVTQDDEPIIITSVHHKNGWTYVLHTPEEVDRNRFVKSIVQVLLVEMANRASGSRQAELPPWLAEGLAQRLQATSLGGLTLEPKTSVVRKLRSSDPLASVRLCLRANKPLSLDELDWPSERADEGDMVYAQCAHLLVHELLRLNNGRACLLELIQQVHENLNWQTAFFRAFGGYFPRLVDLDKWWSMRAVQFTQGEPFAALSIDEQWRQVDDALAVRVSTHKSPNDLPTRTQISLQQVITDWDYTDQEPLLAQKLSALRSVELRLQPIAGEIIEQYWVALTRYIHARQRARTGSLLKNDFSSNVRLVLKDTVKRLNSLDAKREQIRRLRPHVPLTGPGIP
jgi:hypothetical protein